LNKILLSNEVIIYLSSEIIIFILQSIAFFYVIQILRYWDFKSTTSKQYKLENKTYLIMLLIYFTVVIKIVLFPYFISTLDNLSILVPGAMCAAGVVNANIYGGNLLILKLLTLFVMGLWIVINHLDLQYKNYPYTKKKFWVYILIFALVLAELVLDIIYLTNIDIMEPVLCCSVIFKHKQTGYSLLNCDVKTLVLLFYTLYVVNILTAIFKSKIGQFILGVLFVYISYFAVVYFFGTYIYELPTHNCPYCMLQKEYWYVGYIVWSTLFLGTFFAVVGLPIYLITKKEFNIFYKYSIVFNTIFVFICSFYVLRYYLSNGVFL